MNKLRDFFNKYNIGDFLLIFFVMLFLFFIFYGKCSKYIIDFSREAFLPWQMLEGKLLYKDLFNVYGPLGYQINAAAFKIFGVNLNVLYWLGFINSVFVSFFVYLITKLFTDRKIALTVTALISVFCIFTVSIHNLLIPYSYNAVYALSSLLASVYLMLLYLRNKEHHLVCLSFLFAGFSFANKIEYLPYFCFLFSVLPFIVKNKKDFKEYLCPIVSFGIFPVLSFAVLIIQGVSISELLNSFVLIKKLLEVPATNYFYRMYGLYYHRIFLFDSIRHFFSILIRMALPLIAFYLLNFVNVRYIKNKAVKILINVFIFVSVLALAVFTLSFVENNSYFFNWVGIFVLSILIGIVFNAIYKCVRNKATEASKEWGLFVFLCVASLLVSFKGLFRVSAEFYGTLSLPLLLIVFYVFLTKYFPKLLKNIDFNAWNKAILNISFAGIFLIVAMNLENAIANSSELIRTDRGIIFNQYLYKGQNKFVNYIKNNTPKDSTIVVMPEGALINFLTDRKTHGYYYYLIPVNMQVFGEEKIVNDFKDNPPDYFVVSNTPYGCYNEGSIYQFAPKLMRFVRENYEVEVVTDSEIEFVLFKLKRKI